MCQNDILTVGLGIKLMILHNIIYTISQNVHGSKIALGGV